MPTITNDDPSRNNNNDDEKERRRLTERTSSARSSVGAGSIRFSDFMNDNLIAARYVAAASISLVAFYGILHTPLFFRYRTVADIPAAYFVYRTKLTCRVISVMEIPEGPVTCRLRHLSPVERILSRTWFDRFMKLHPSVAVGKRPDESPDELLLVNVAGIQSAPVYLSLTENHGDWLRQLAEDHALVQCQLLARKVPNVVIEDNNRKKRKIPEFSDDTEPSYGIDQAAIGRLYYRPTWTALFPRDIGAEMVQSGRASASSSSLYPRTDAPAAERLVDTTHNVKDLKYDAAYLASLSRLEFVAAKGSYGMWGDSTVRQRRSDVVDEVEFQEHATMWQKVWRWIRG